MAQAEVAPTSAQHAASSDCDVTVVVPTYCEAGNLAVLVPRVATALSGADLRGEIVIVDDDSPDDTEPACKELAHDYRLRLLVRKGQRGLASAVLHGMQQARGAVLVVMDADLSHPPDKVPELVAALQQGDVDFVIGSRYVPGGSTGTSWGLSRWFNSKVATLLARPLTSVRDPLAGFFALRRDTFLNGAPFDPVGFKIGLELLVKCGCRRVAEVPIAFVDRRHGQSKMSIKVQLNYLRHLARLYAFRLRTPAPRRQPRMD
jgi:glycosyltransferase involved in cell wall biosynthesis